MHVASDRNLIDARLPVQYVIRPRCVAHPDCRDYAGKVAGGVFKPGDEVIVLPIVFTTRIAAIDTADGPMDEAFPPMSVTIRLEDDLDVSRGDMICRPNNMPTRSQDIDAMVSWVSEAPLRPGQKLAVKHTTCSARVLVKGLQYRLDVNTLHRVEDAVELRLNDIGRVRSRATQPLLFDPCRRNRAIGGFVLVDESINRTVGAGMVN